MWKLTYTGSFFVVSRYLDRDIRSLFYYVTSVFILSIARLFHFPSNFFPLFIRPYSLVSISSPPWRHVDPSRHAQIPPPPPPPPAVQCSHKLHSALDMYNIRTTHQYISCPWRPLLHSYSATSNFLLWTFEMLGSICSAGPAASRQANTDASEHGQKKKRFFERTKILL